MIFSKIFDVFGSSLQDRKIYLLKKYFFSRFLKNISQINYPNLKGLSNKIDNKNYKLKWETFELNIQNLISKLIFLFKMCTKKSHAVPVDKYRAFHPSLIKSLHKASLKLREEEDIT
ncbi:MAG: hypothetical protein AUK59_01640 [Candidatus Altarchaeum sp. CG2_30_32_3053]|nr:MAG: hypothetical protein AUK59_01640 [Candidatus Altarchaeum sp. CG2_30_32_3053]